MDRKQDVKTVGTNEKGSDVSKKAYEKPKLTVHGKVEDITRNIFEAGGSDGVYGSSM